jgi:hypothetical protein
VILETGAGDEGFEAYTQHHFKTVSSNINMLACSAYWSTIKTLPATLPEPRSVEGHAQNSEANFQHERYTKNKREEACGCG